MAIINCCECGKEISDKAKICPHCGYKKEGSLVKFVKNPKNRIFLFAGGIIVVFLLIILAANHWKMDSPFERITGQTTRKDVIRLFGKGEQMEGIIEQDDLYYLNSKYWGLNGTLIFYFYDDGEIINGIWSYRLEDEETFDDYNDQITKIIEFYTDLYGKPLERGDEYIWYDKSDNEYTLRLRDTELMGMPYKAINVWFDPY